MSPRRIDVRPCSEADLDRLRADWPTSGRDIHGVHHSAQQAGRATYLVAWRGSTTSRCVRICVAGAPALR